MCGIVGVYHYGNAGRVDRDALERMSDAVRHRGPDGAGRYVTDKVALAMRRLAIIDVAGGRQPIANENETIRLVCNGEIYNHADLRKELESAGHKFRTGSDVEVIVHLYEAYGVECVKKLRGMFAFALWDESAERLMLARDRVGKKPLFYTEMNGTIAWASELRALTLAPGAPRDISPSAIDMFLTLQYIPSPHTVFDGIFKLPPGHRLVVEKKRVVVEPYWSLPGPGGPMFSHPGEAERAIREKLREATRIRLMSDVPIGAFLSGGVDSSLVVGLMSEVSDQPVRTFSIGFEDAAFSELPFAEEVARRFGTRHTSFVVKPEMAEILPMIAAQFGEPFGDYSAFPTYFVARETRRHVTVALNGDGGDESFGGYLRYRYMSLFRQLDAVPPSMRAAAGAVSEIIPPSGWGSKRVRQMRRAMGSLLTAPIPARYLNMVGVFNPSDKTALYAPGFRARLENDPSLSYIEGAFSRAAGHDFLNKMLHVDFETYLPECLMTKVDMMTMANSLEGRSPLLDHELIELSFRIAGNWKLRGAEGKWILKRACADLIPASVRNRRKMGFGIPVDRWFRGQLRPLWRDRVLSPRALARGYFEKAALEKIDDDHAAGRRNNGHRMWNLLMLELWHMACAPEARVD